MNFGLIPASKHRIFCASICINISSVESNTKCRMKSSAIIRNHWTLDNWLDTSEIPGKCNFYLSAIKWKNGGKNLCPRFKKRLFGIRKKAKRVGWEFEDEIDFFITEVENIFEKGYIKLFSNRQKNLNMNNRLNRRMEIQLKKDLISAIGWLVLWIIVKSYINACAP